MPKKIIRKTGRPKGSLNNLMSKTTLIKTLLAFLNSISEEEKDIVEFRTVLKELFVLFKPDKEGEKDKEFFNISSFESALKGIIDCYKQVQGIKTIYGKSIETLIKALSFDPVKNTSAKNSTPEPGETKESINSFFSDD